MVHVGQVTYFRKSKQEESAISFIRVSPQKLVVVKVFTLLWIPRGHLEMSLLTSCPDFKCLNGVIGSHQGVHIGISDVQCVYTTNMTL